MRRTASDIAADQSAPTTERIATIGEALKRTRMAIVVVGVFSFILAILVLTLPFYMLQVFDRVLSSRSTDTLIALTLIAVFCLAMLGALDAVRTRILSAIDQWMEAALMPEIAERTHELALENPGIVGTTAVGDLRNIRRFFSGPALAAIFDAAFSPVFLIVIFLVHPLMGLIALVGVVGLVAISLINDWRVKGPREKAREASGKMTVELNRATRNSEVIEAMGMGSTIYSRIAEHSERTRILSNRANSVTADYAAFTKFFRFAIQVAMMGTGVWLALQNAITPGAMIAGSIIMGRALAPYEQMLRAWGSVVAARSSYQNLRKTMETNRRPRSQMTYPDPVGELSLEKVGIILPGSSKPALSNISFTLPAGQALGIIGPSAAGKSTLARIISGVWRPTFGHVRLDNIDMANWDRSDLGRHIGYVPQDIELLSGSVRDNIARFQITDDESVINAAKHANAHDLISHLKDGYDTDIGEGGAFLSGGQRQRIALARALFGNPKILILDEPNSSLDGEGEQALVTSLQTIRDAGTTIIMVAHKPSVLGFVDKLLLIKDGQLHMYGPRSDILQKLQPKPYVVPAEPAMSQVEGTSLTIIESKN